MKLFKNLFLIPLLLVVINSTAQNGGLKNYTLKDGLPSLKITNLTQDKTGYLWFSTDKGISRFDGNEFVNFSTKNGLISNNVFVSSNKNNQSLIGTNKGISIKKQNSFTNFEGKQINCILNTNNHTFLGTSKGIYRVREDFLSPLRTNFQIDLNIINDLKFDGKFYWIATNKGLWKLDELMNPKTLKRIALGNFTSILLNKKNHLATTYNNGLKVIENNTVTDILINAKKVTSIKLINNQFWITSKEDGIEILDTNFNFIKSVNKYNTLKTNQINAVFQDLQKNIWIATNNKGLYKFRGSTTTTLKPIITFQNIDVVYKSLDSININNYPKTLQLKPNKNHLSFSFKAININKPKEVEYRYKLNNEFSPWTKNNSVNFANLNSGNYTFTAQSKIGKLESDPIHFQFFIDKPIHKKEWFKWSIIGGLFVLLGGITYSYIKKTKAKNKAKIEKLQLENHLLSLEQKALQLQMNPHFIFNVLNGIKALGNSGNSIELNSTISKFATLLRGILHNSRQEEISLAEEITTLKNYLELEQQMNLNSFEYQINTDLNIDTEEILIPPMLIQPFIENSIKHGIKSIKDGKIVINFSIKKDFLQCSITDNGIGLSQSKLNKKASDHNSIAVEVTKERIKSLSNKNLFTISEIIENKTVIGTKVFFRIPLKTDF